MRHIAPFGSERLLEAILRGWLADFNIIRVERFSVTSQPRSLRGCSCGAK